MRVLKLGVLSAAASGLVLANFALAQQHNPVPTRLSVEHYGLPDGKTMDLRVSCVLDDPVASRIHVVGGRPGKAAYLLVAPSPADLPLPWGGRLLVAPNAIPFGGTFDDQGMFDLPLDVANLDYVGATVYFQAVEVDLTAPRPVTLSYGLALTFVAGNEQPVLSYVGPPQTVTLCKTEGAVHTYGLLTQVLAPRLGYTLTEVTRQTDGGHTQVFLRLVEPAEATGWKLDNKRLYLALGENVGMEIEVWIEQVRADDTVPPVFGLAAVVQKMF